MIRFRSHHFMCTLGFQGYGYSPNFVSNYKKIVTQIPSVSIQVVASLDGICSACPNQTKQKKCIKETKILELDRKHMGVLEIKIGQILKWNEALQIIKEKMSIEKFEYACLECNWKPYGMCINALKKLKGCAINTI